MHFQASVAWQGFLVGFEGARHLQLPCLPTSPNSKPPLRCTFLLINRKLRRYTLFGLASLLFPRSSRSVWLHASVPLQ